MNESVDGRALLLEHGRDLLPVFTCTSPTEAFLESDHDEDDVDAIGDFDEATLLQPLTQLNSSPYRDETLLEEEGDDAHRPALCRIETILANITHALAHDGEISLAVQCRRKGAVAVDHLNSSRSRVRKLGFPGNSSHEAWRFSI